MADESDALTHKFVEGLESLALGVKKIKIVDRALSEQDPKAGPKTPIGLTRSEIAAFSRKMSEALAYFNGARGGSTTVERLRSMADHQET